MFRVRRGVWILAALSIFASVSEGFGAEASGIPRLYFGFSRPFESECKSMSGEEIPAAWEREAYERVGEFQALWDREGPALLRTLVRRFGRGFERRELTATLSVCATTSLSAPLIIGVRRFLKSAGGESFSREAFVDLVFHELLHTWVAENVREGTPMLRKWKRLGLSQISLNHLHLMALQKEIYLSLGLKDRVAWLRQVYPAMPEEYSRAWKVVDRLEGHAAFVSEIGEWRG